MADRSGQSLGHYRLVRLLGQGGFAEVYLGEHIHLGTQAAIKLLHTQLAGEDTDAFRTEARTIARLEHPHIVRVFDFGIEGETPYLVMDYAPGGTVRKQHPRGVALPLPTILDYVKQVALALQYAHDQHFIHRDIKPENLLVGGRQEILLSDFGIALLAQTSRSQSMQDVTGTASYMAPEQFQGKPRQASDQYALAVMVYEWLTGACPFHGSFTEIASQHLFVPPPPLREQVPGLSPAVEQVVLTALAKDPHQRFASVQAFATAFEEASQAELTETIPASHSSLSTELATAPNESVIPTELVTPASLAPTEYAQLSPPASALAPTVYVQPSPPDSTEPAYDPNATWGALTFIDGKQLRLSGERAVVGRYDPDVGGIQPEVDLNSMPGADTVSRIHAYIERIGSTYTLTDLNSTNATRINNKRLEPDKSTPINDGDTLQFGKVTCTFKTSTLPPTQRASALPPTVYAQPSPLASALPPTQRASVIPPPGTLLFTYRGHSENVSPLAWSPDGKRIASGGGYKDNTVQVWDAANGGNVFTYRGHSGSGVGVSAMAWSRDSRRIASAGCVDQMVQVWDAADGKHVFIYRGHKYGACAVAWSPDGRRIASGGFEGTVQVWDAANGKHVFIYQGHTNVERNNSIKGVVWSPDGQRIASYGFNEKTVQVWNAFNGSLIFTYRGYKEEVYALTWSPDGKRIASASVGDSTVQVWDAADGGNVFTYRGHTAAVWAVVWSPDGRRIASGSLDHTVQVWDATTEQTLYTYRGHSQGVCAVAWSPDGKYIASGAYDKTVQVWQAGLW